MFPHIFLLFSLNFVNFKTYKATDTLNNKKYFIIFNFKFYMYIICFYLYYFIFIFLLLFFLYRYIFIINAKMTISFLCFWVLFSYIKFAYFLYINLTNFFKILHIFFKICFLFNHIYNYFFIIMLLSYYLILYLILYFNLLFIDIYFLLLIYLFFTVYFI